jgi:hypothetical protein
MRALPLLALATLAACSAEPIDTLDAVTDGGNYRVLLDPEPYPAVTGPNYLHFQVLDPSGLPSPTEGFRVTAWMPAHIHEELEAEPAQHLGHDASSDDGAADTGLGADGVIDPGHYHSGLTFTMPGLWELEVTVDCPDGEESTRLLIDVR